MKISTLLIYLCIGCFTLLAPQESHAQEDNPTNIETQADTYEIGGIKVIGNYSSEAKAIIAVSGLKVGNLISIPGSAIPMASKAIWKMKLFTDVEIHKSKTIGNIIFLEIKVVESKPIYGISITGVKKANKTDLKNILDAYLQKGAIATKSIKHKTKLAVQKFYAEKGLSLIHI